MAYQYQNERARLFTEDGQVMLLKVRDTAQKLLETAGAFQAGKAWKNVSGDTWQMMACLDRLVELGELRKVTADGETWGQYQVFVSAREAR